MLSGGRRSRFACVSCKDFWRGVKASWNDSVVVIVAIVVDKDGWLRYVSSTSEVLNSWWNICLCHSIFECWVDDLHDLSTTNTSSSIRSGPITPCVEVTSCLSLLPDILLEFCISLKGLLAIFKYVLKNC